MTVLKYDYYFTCISIDRILTSPVLDFIAFVLREKKELNLTDF